jgi:hypothetical protein
MFMSITIFLLHFTPYCHQKPCRLLVYNCVSSFLFSSRCCVNLLFGFLCLYIELTSGNSRTLLLEIVVFPLQAYCIMLVYPQESVLRGDVDLV